MAQVEPDEVPVFDNGFIAYARNVHEDKEYECDEEKEGGCERPYLACAGCALDLLFAELRHHCWRRCL